MLINPTGPQLEAKTVPINNVIQNRLCGRKRLRPSTIRLISAIAVRVRPKLSAVFWIPKSLLTLKPTSDKKVDADDSAAQTIPATNTAPR